MPPPLVNAEEGSKGSSSVYSKGSSSSSRKKLRRLPSAPSIARARSDTLSARLDTTNGRKSFSTPSIYSVQSNHTNIVQRDEATGRLSIPPAYRIDQEGFNEAGRYPTLDASAFSENIIHSQVPITKTSSVRSWAPVQTPMPSVRRDSYREPSIRKEPSVRSRGSYREPSIYKESHRDERHEASEKSWKQEKYVSDEYEEDKYASRMVNPRVSMGVDFGQSVSSEFRYAEPPPVALGRGDVWDSQSRFSDHPSRRGDPWANDRASETIEAVVHEREFDEDDYDPEPEMYHYIVPAGAKVVFQDIYGNVITRIGPKSKNRRMEFNTNSKNVPIVVHDEFGKELYKTLPLKQPFNSFGSYGGDYRQSSSHFGNFGKATSYDSRGYHRPPWLSASSGSLSSSSSTKTIFVDERGNQFPVRSRSVSRERAPRVQQPFSHDISYHGTIYDG